MRAAIALAAAAALLSAPIAARAAAGGVTVVRQSDAQADLIGTEVLLQAGLDRQEHRQDGLAALTAECILKTPVSLAGTPVRPLEDAVEAAGGSVTFFMEPRRVRFYLEGIAKAYPAMLQAFHTALVHPDFSPAAVAAAKSALYGKIARNQHSPLSAGIDMLNLAFYQDSNAGLPPYGMAQTVSGFSAADVRAFYAAHYRSGGAVVSAAGNLAAAPSLDLQGAVAGLPAGTSAPFATHMPALPAVSRQLIAHRDVPVPWLVAQYPAPDLRSKDFGPMLVLTEFLERTLADVAEVPTIATPAASERGVGAFYNFDTTPANVIIYVDGGLGDPTRTFATALTVVNVLGHAKLGGDLSQMKAFAKGRLLDDTQTIEDRAWLGGVYASRGLNGDYLPQIVKSIDSASNADLQRVAQKYLGAPTIALILPRAQNALANPTP